MKLTFLLTFLTAFQLMAVESYSQLTKLTLKLENVKLSQALATIEDNSEFNFLYSPRLIDVNRTVSINAKDETIKDILTNIFDKDVKFTVYDKQIVLLPEKGEAQTTDSPQQVTIRGKVTDASSGDALPGVNIVVKGTTTGAISDVSGNYSISSSQKTGTLVFTFIGYITREIPIEGKSVIDVSMTADVKGLDEVVVVGYGTQKKANLTGAVSQVSSKVLENRSVTNVGQGLQGAIGNLNVVTNPGDPGKIGQGATFQIRGPGSINGGSPLILIDGVQGDLNQVNPNDIENISVLKDAASASIYGARATFGVILVTTKKGSKNKMSVTVNSYVSQSSITDFPKVVNSLTYAEVVNEASRNAGIAEYFSPEQIDRIKRYMANPSSIPTTVPDPTDPSKWSYALGNDNINYMKIYYKDHMYNQKYDVAISGGSEKIDYRFSAGFLDQGGVYRFGQDVFKRYNILGNVNSQINNWLSFKIQTMFNSGITDEPYEYAGNMGNYFHTAYTRQPHWAFYDPNGFPMWTSQKQYFEGARRVTKNDEMKLVGEMIIEPIKGWKINTRLSYDKLLEDGAAHEAKLYANNTDGSPYVLFPNSSFTRSYWVRNYKNLEVFSTYNKKLGEHVINLLAGMQVEGFNGTTLGGYLPNLVTDAIPSLNTGTGKKDTWDDIDEWLNMGYFGRVNYNYKERYLFEANVRYDATSKFPSGQRWGFFPSVSAGWNISNESFYNFKQVNLLKLRGSYGFLGNQQISNYMFYSTVPIGSNLGWMINGDRPYYIGTPGLVSNNLTWATAKTIDFGLDMQALDSRINLTFDWYSRNTIDMIGPANAVPGVLGTSVPQTNNADMKTNGFELTLGWRDRIGNDLDYNIQLTLSDYTTKITRYNNPNKLLSTYYEGMKIGEIWGYETVGIIQNDEQLANMANQQTFINRNPWHIGDIEYRDLNGDKVISPGKGTLDDPGDKKIIGNNTPRYAFGLITDLKWKGIDFSMFWQGIGKRDLWLGDIPFFGITGSWTQQVYETTTNYWREDNRDAYFARPYITPEIQKNQIVQSRFLQNGAYARLKNLQIGYTLPQHLLESVKLDKVRIYVSGENLFYISPIDENFDPERVSGSWGAGKTYPILRTFTAGINLGF